MSEFNVSLLSKWSWRIMTNQRESWFTILSHKYGINRGMVLDGRRNDSFWWMDLQTLKIWVGLNMGSWFDDHHFRVMDIGD